MRRIFFIAWWGLLGSAGIIAFFRYMHPATFSRSTFPIILGFAFTSLLCALANKRYE